MANDMSMFADKDGFLCVRLLRDDGQWVVRRVHELVAETFVPNPDLLPEVRHKDGNLKNNNADNLEWCRPEDNTDRQGG
jgi:hypothetical protein